VKCYSETETDVTCEMVQPNFSRPNTEIYYRNTKNVVEKTLTVAVTKTLQKITLQRRTTTEHNITAS